MGVKPWRQPNVELTSSGINSHPALRRTRQPKAGGGLLGQRQSRETDCLNGWQLSGEAAALLDDWNVGESCPSYWLARMSAFPTPVPGTEQVEDGL